MVRNQQLTKNGVDYENPFKSYRRTQEFIENPPGNLQVFEIYPPTPLKSSALGSRLSSLNYDYHTGRHCGRYFLAALGDCFTQQNIHLTESFDKQTAQDEILLEDDYVEAAVAQYQLDKQQNSELNEHEKQQVNIIERIASGK